LATRSVAKRRRKQRRPWRRWRWPQLQWPCPIAYSLSGCRLSSYRSRCCLLCPAKDGRGESVRGHGDGGQSGECGPVRRPQQNGGGDGGCGCDERAHGRGSSSFPIRLKTCVSSSYFTYHQHSSHSYYMITFTISLKCTEEYKKMKEIVSFISVIE
jgi:hypothetical protein